MDLYIVVAISDWVLLTDICRVQQFLASTNFYKSFIKAFSNLVAHIITVLQKEPSCPALQKLSQSLVTEQAIHLNTHPDSCRSH